MEKYANAKVVARNEDGSYNRTMVLGTPPMGCKYVVTGVYASSPADMGFTWRDVEGALIVPATWWGKNITGIDVERPGGLFESDCAVYVENPTLGDIALQVSYRVEPDAGPVS